MDEYVKHINVKAKKEVYISFKKLALDRSAPLPVLFEEIYREYANNHGILIDNISTTSQEEVIVTTTQDTTVSEVIPFNPDETLVNTNNN